MDPLAEIYHFQTPYAYAANSPVRFIDWMGMGPTLGEMWDMAGSGNATFNFDNGEVTDWYTWNEDDEGSVSITSWGEWDDDTDDFTVTYTDTDNVAIGRHRDKGMFAEYQIGDHYIRNYIKPQGGGIYSAAEYDQKGGYHIYGNGGNPKLPTAKYIYGSIDMSTRGHKIVEMASYTWELIWSVSDKSLVKYNNQLLKSHEIGDTIDNFVYWHHCRQCGAPYFQTVIKTDSTRVNRIP